MLSPKKSVLFVALSLGLALASCSKDEASVNNSVGAAADGSQGNPAEPPAVSQAFTAETIYFEFDKSDLSSSAQASLSSLADHLKSGAPNASMQVEGHCDERGTTQYNLALGERRALSVKTFLVNLGVTDTRISTISYGEERPAVQGHDEDSWSKNRRVEFILQN